MNLNDLSVDKLNYAIQSLNNESIQKKKISKNTKLKLEYDKAKENIIAGPQELNNAEKKYYEAVHGLNVYNELLQERYLNEINDINEVENNKFLEKKEEIISLINEYKTSIIYLEKITELKEKLEEENNKYKKDIDDFIAINNTNNRKTYYTDNEITSIMKWDYILKKIYIIILIILSIKLFYIDNLYYNKFVWGILIFLLLLPYLFIPIISKLIQLLYDDLNTNNKEKTIFSLLKDMIIIIISELQSMSYAILYPFEILFYPFRLLFSIMQ